MNIDLREIVKTDIENNLEKLEFPKEESVENFNKIWIYLKNALVTPTKQHLMKDKEEKKRMDKQ